MFLLTIDVGNTNIAMGAIENDKVIASFRLTTSTPRTSDEFVICFHSFLSTHDINPNDIQDVIISSVVPKVMYSLTSAVTKYLKKQPLIIGPGIKTGIKIHTDNPKEVGADRIVGVTAAYYTYHKSCIVVDFGTATTFDYISGEGVFQYTVIAPGIGICADALTHSTAKLPEIEIKKPVSILAGNTISGMQAGIVYGYIGQVNHIIRQMKLELQDEGCTVIATGGLGKMFANECSEIDLYDPNIAYTGMNIIYKKNEGKK